MRSASMAGTEAHRIDKKSRYKVHMEFASAVKADASIIFVFNAGDEMKRMVAAIVFAISSSSAFSVEQILCTPTAGGSDVVVALDSFKKFKRTFNCVSGPFVVDLSGCAPSGAYGLHSPTGSASLIGVVDRWQDYMSHLGGITSSSVTDHDIAFTGGFVGPNRGYRASWGFSVSRLTGVGRLEEEGGAVSTYSCKKADKLF